MIETRREVMLTSCEEAPYCRDKAYTVSIIVSGMGLGASCEGGLSLKFDCWL